MRRLVVLGVGLVTIATGCKTCEETGNTTLSLSPIIGLLGMAVDGDDKDDYEHFFHGEECDCRRCR